MMRPILTGLLFISAIHPLVPMAQVYKWVDQNGVTHYGERPPATAAPASKLDIDLQGNGPAVPPPGCYSIQCQYERLRADRLIREEEWRKEMQVRRQVHQSREPAPAQSSPAPLVVPIPGHFHRRQVILPPRTPGLPSGPGSGGGSAPDSGGQLRMPP